MSTPRPPLHERFAAPRAAARMLKIVHGWPDQPEEQARQIAALQAQGYGGVVTNIRFDGGYVEDPGRWAALRSALSQLRSAGLRLWLYDEEGYPSGRAGRIVLRDHPDLEAQGLMLAWREVGTEPVTLDVPPGQLLLAAAFPLTAGALDPDCRTELTPVDGKVTWVAPAGRWGLLAVTVGRLYEGTQVACSGLPEHTATVDLLNPRTAEHFLRVTHERYEANLPGGVCAWFEATFTDEPSSMAIFFNQMPYATLPWSAGLAAEFRERRGYDLLPVLPCLIAAAGDRGSQVRHDFYRTVSEVLVDSWWKPLQAWCEEHGIASGGHALLEENILHHVPLYGDLFTAFRHLDSSGIDCLRSDPAVPRYRSLAGMGADVPWNAARLAESAAELDGKPMVMCEVSEFLQQMARPPALVSLEQRRGTWARLLLGGINVLTSYHAFTGVTDAQIRDANDWIGRCLEAVAGGRRAARVAVLYPIESVWPRFTPSALWVESVSPECRQIEMTLRDLSETLYAARREFAYIDSRTLCEGTVCAGALTWDEHRWQVVVLPMADTLPEAAWRKLQELRQAGGLIVALGARPRNTDRAFPWAGAAALNEALFGSGGDGPPAIFLAADRAAELSALLDRVLPRDIEVGAADSPIRISRRRIEAHEVWLVLNDSPAPWGGNVTVPARGPGEVLDPQAGSIRAQASADNVPLELPPYGVAILRFPAP